MRGLLLLGSLGLWFTACHASHVARPSGADAGRAAEVTADCAPGGVGDACGGIVFVLPDAVCRLDDGTVVAWTRSSGFELSGCWAQEDGTFALQIVHCEPGGAVRARAAACRDAPPAGPLAFTDRFGGNGATVYAPSPGRCALREALGEPAVEEVCWDAPPSCSSPSVCLPAGP